MKKYFFVVLAAIAMLSSCSSGSDSGLDNNIFKQPLIFTATMEGNNGARATYDSGKKCAAWEVGDQISINGVNYTAQEVGAATTFKATVAGTEATGETYNAYFPANLYNGTTATLPAVQTYKAGTFNMPMYAESTTTELRFKNLCALLAIKITRDDISTLKSIKVKSDKKMNGTFTVSNDTAVVGDDGTDQVVLESSTVLELTDEGTTFYIAIPAQKYAYLNIFLSSDGNTYTQAMATKKATGLGAIARNKIFNIDYKKNATKLWRGTVLVADCNIGATSETGYGQANWPLTSVVTEAWGSNWRLPTMLELDNLISKCTSEWTSVENVNGRKFTGIEAFSSNSVFIPAAGDYSAGYLSYQNENGLYASSTQIDGNNAYGLKFNSEKSSVTKYLNLITSCFFRAVLEEAPPTTGTAKGPNNIEVPWVQLWEGGLKWALYNVGAANGKAEDYGGYYTYGGKKENGNGKPWDTEGTIYTCLYLSGNLEGEDDVATRVWGWNWRMPIGFEYNLLFDNCDYELTTLNGVTGCKITGRGDYAYNSIFLPAAGFYYYSTDVANLGKGYYWSSTSNGSKYSLCLEFLNESSEYSINRWCDNYNACSVRAVLRE